MNNYTQNVAPDIDYAEAEKSTLRHLSKMTEFSLLYSESPESYKDDIRKFLKV